MEVEFRKGMGETFAASDLARRADLTDRQAIDALRLLTGIVRRSGLSIDFSDGEIALLILTRGLPCRMPTFRLKKPVT